MFRTLNTKILLYFITILLIAVGIISLSIHLGLTHQFSSYLNQSRQVKINQMVDNLINEYEKSGDLASPTIESVMHDQSMSDRLFYKIIDKNGQVIVDSTQMMIMMSQMGPMGRNRQTLNYKTIVLPIQVNQTKIGTLQAYYPKGYQSQDVKFLKDIDRYIILAAVITLILTVLISLLISRKLTKGLKQVTRVAKSLQQHDFSARAETVQPTLEVEDLALAFNHLSESLSREEGLRKQFTHDLAHELRTPLATLRSQLEAFQDGIWEPTPERLQQCHDELMRLIRLVNDLERLMAAENPMMQLSIKTFYSEQIVKDVYEQFHPLFNDKNIQFILKPSQNIEFCADRDRLIQILSNLLNNAYKYTTPGGRVMLSVEENKTHIFYKISDSGMGIPQEHIAHVFERFYRGDQSRDRKTGGIGVGLAIVKALVEAHQGTVSVQSEKGVGTTFTISLPKQTVKRKG